MFSVCSVLCFACLHRPTFSLSFLLYLLSISIFSCLSITPLISLFHLFFFIFPMLLYLSLSHLVFYLSYVLLYVSLSLSHTHSHTHTHTHTTVSTHTEYPSSLSYLF